jgi:hypothetical protein
VYRLFFIFILPFRLRENSGFPWLSFSGQVTLVHIGNADVHYGA